MNQHPPGGRTAFTLVELMITISIIALLLALIVPAVQSSFGSARVAQVRTEIGAFEKSIADFKVKYGSEPPSSITIPENFGTTGQNWTVANKAAIRRIFGPKFNFVHAAAADQIDLNGDGDTSDTHTLNGAQCLLFFLAGPRDTSGVPQGFSKNSAKPFQIDGGERIVFLSELDASRVVDGPGTGMPMPIYQAPNGYGVYAYIRADEYGDTPTIAAFDGLGPTGDAYTQKGGTAYWKPQSYQIICSGADTRFGTGGEYDPDNADADLAGTREDERDNITNFAQGLLAN
jgi:prepilin-type N-terminal cleavage/methylation domain-containing protein